MTFTDWSIASRSGTFATYSRGDEARNFMLVLPTGQKAETIVFCEKAICLQNQVDILELKRQVKVMTV